MIQIAPTVTEANLNNFNDYLKIIAKFSSRIHFDFADGKFAPTRLIQPVECHWPDQIEADFHLMFENPLEHLETIISQKPNLVVVHAESNSAKEMLDEMNSAQIKVGIAILPETEVTSVTQLIENSEHVLIFAGKLGHQGGNADLSQLNKVEEIRSIAPSIEIGWDGGVSLENAKIISEAGIDVLNVGGYIKHDPSPQEAYARLDRELNSS